MITKTVDYEFDETLYSLFESNDHEFSGGRAKLTLKKDKNNMSLKIVAKDEAAFRAMKKSIENTETIMSKVRGAI